MASFRRKTKGGNWYFRFVDADGVNRERRGCPDRRETERMAAAAESEAAKVRAGLIDLRALSLVAHAKRPLAEHLDAWDADIRARGDTAKHARLFTDRARRLVAVLRGAKPNDLDTAKLTRAAAAEARRKLTEAVTAARMADLTTERVQGALAALRAAGRSLATINHHRAAIRAFTRWAVQTGRLAADPLAGVAGYNAKEDRRHDRRTLALDELRRLIEAAASGPTYRLMTGPARALCYRLAVDTGLRYSEIKSVTPAALALGDAPTVTVPAAYTKNGDPATLPLPADLAADLAAFVAGMAPDAPVFPLPDKGADMLKVDLAAAGIPYRDAAGLVFDFHALRCQCATLADAAGITPRVVQRLMRHSTLELTGRYTRPRAVDIERATAALPNLRPSTAPDTQADTARATGTEGRSISDRLSHYLPKGGDGSGRELSVTGVNIKADSPPSICHNSLENQGVDASRRASSASVGNSGDRTRTGDLRIMRPPPASPIVSYSKALRPKPGDVAQHLPIDKRPMPPDLAALVAAWPQLPEAIRAGILAMVRASTPLP